MASYLECSADKPMGKPWVAIYRHDLLGFSETFIREQAEQLQNFCAFYIGLRKIEGINLPLDRVAVVNSGTRTGKLAEFGFQAFGFSSRLLKVLRKVRPLLIHAHFEGCGIAMLGLAKLLGIPLIVTCHGFDVTMHDVDRWPNPLLRAIYKIRRRRLQRDGRLFIAVSEHIKRHMLARGYPDNRIVVHYIGVDCQRLRADPAVVREPIVLFAGRLVEKKGCEYLIRAMQMVQRDDSTIRLVVIGDGPFRDSLESLANSLLVRAEFIGIQHADSVSRLMNKARVLCVPTVRAANGDMDGCCVVFQEAHAMGLPVVAFDTGGTPEAVHQGQTGLLVPERDCDALADAIHKMVNDQLLWEQFSKAARLLAECRFNLATQNKRLEEIYNELLAEIYLPR